MAAGMEQAARARADSITALGIGEMGIGNTSTSRRGAVRADRCGHRGRHRPGAAD